MVNPELVRQLDELKKSGPRRMPPPRKSREEEEVTEAQSAFELLAEQVRTHNARIAKLERDTKKPQFEEGVPTVEQMAETIKHILAKEHALTEIYYFLFRELGESDDFQRFFRRWENARKLWEQMPNRWWYDHRWMKMESLMLIVRSADATERLIAEWRDRSNNTRET